MLLMIDLRNAEVFPLQENIRSKVYFAWSKDSSRYALGTNTTVHVFTAEGDPVCKIPTEGRFPSGIFFEGVDLYVLYNNGNLFRYQLADSGGTEAGTTKLGVDTGDDKDYELLADETALYLQAYGGTGWLAVIDTETMEVENLIESAIGYFPETCVILTGTWNRNEKQYIATAFEHYSTGRLREKAAAFIGGNEIRSEMRDQYGLNAPEGERK